MRELLGLALIAYIALSIGYVRNQEPELTDTQLFLCIPEIVVHLRCTRFNQPQEGEENE